MNFKEILERIILRLNLSQDDASHLMEEIMSGRLTSAQISAILVALRMKGETVDEITGFVTTMRKWVRPLDTQNIRVVDTCGTGGDGAKTFNISTLAAFVTAGAGVAVAKHGNVAVSGQCGSADLLKRLGVKIDVDPVIMEKALKEVGMCFLFAPQYHPAMKHAGPPRREIGIRTIFNILGPLTNPAGAKAQILGVFNRDLTQPLAEVLLKLGAEHAFVVHGEDGLDEVTTTGKTFIVEVKRGEVKVETFTPDSLGLSLSTPRDLRGGDVETNFAIAQAILEGKKGPQRDIVLLNASFAIVAGNAATDLHEAMEKASESIDSGKALKKLKDLVEVTSHS